MQLHGAKSLLIPLSKTLGIISCHRQEICAIPGVAPNLLGVVNQRGQLLWILMLSEFLGLTQIGDRAKMSEKLFVLTVTSDSGATITETGEQQSQLGCVVQKIQGIIAIDSQTYTPVNDEFEDGVKPMLLGMTDLQGDRLAILDVQKLLSVLRAY